MKSLAALFVVISLLVVGSVQAQSSYNLTLIPDGPPKAINNYGQVIMEHVDVIDGVTIFKAVVWTPDTANGAVGHSVTLIPPSGPEFSCKATAINDRGVVVGTYDDPVKLRRTGFVWTPDRRNGTVGTMQTLPLPPNAIACEVLAINERGTIVGAIYLSRTVTHAAVWQNGQCSDIGTLPGDTSSICSSINNVGVIVGVSSRNDLLSTRAFIFQQGVMTELPRLKGSRVNYPYAINANGMIAGLALMDAPGSVYRAFRWSGKSAVLLPIPPQAKASYAYGINRQGKVAGFYVDVQGNPHAALFGDGVTDLNSAFTGPYAYVAYGVNDVGQVTGYLDIIDDLDNWTTFILTPKH